MQGVFLAAKNLPLCKKTEYGIYTKIIAQIECFSEKYQMIVLSESWKRTIFGKLSARIPFFPNDFGISMNKVPCGIDFLFMRLDLGDRQTIRFLQKTRVKNPTAKIIVEIPTYPLAWKSLKWYTKIVRPKHTYCEKRLHLYADVVAVYQDINALYGLPTLIMSNGIQMSKNPIRTVSDGVDDSIQLISVSSVSASHGIDRMIDGLNDYYKSGGLRNVVLNIVGTGPEYNKLVEITRQHNLQKHVIFYGYRTGEALLDIYARCDIGVECLGSHRNDQSFSSTLKSREYWAKGMPIISECTFPDEVNEISDLILRVPADETPVQVAEVISFFDRVFSGGCYEGKMDIARQLHRFAEEHYSMEKALRPVFEYINGTHENI